MSAVNIRWAFLLLLVSEGPGHTALAKANGPSVNIEPAVSPECGTDLAHYRTLQLRQR